MNAFIKRGLITLAVTGGFLALGTGVAYADDGTSGDGGTGSGSQALLGATLPINVGGNGISILGDSSSSGSSNTGGGSGSSPSVSTGGTNSLLGGSQGAADIDVPVTVSGNAISVLGDSESEGSSFEGSSGAGESGSASTSGKEGILGGSQAVGTVDAPVTVGGNAISVAGDSYSGQSGTGAGTAGSGSSAPSGSTSGDDSTAGGTQVLTDAGIPVVVGGNAVSVVGDSSSTDSAVTGGQTSGSGSGEATTEGSDGTASGSQVVGDADAPVTVGGNAISVVGDSASEGAVTGAAANGGSSDSGASTSGDDAAIGGTQVVAPVAAPVTAGGNAVSVVGDSSSSNATVTSPGTGGGSDASTSGEDGTLGGTQIVTPVDAPITIGGNAASVIGDSTTTGTTTGGGDPGGEVGGETVTPGVVSPAAVGGVSLLAATGSGLLIPALALALLMLAAGATAMVRARIAQS